MAPESRSVFASNLVAIAGAREYTSSVSRLAQGSGSLSVSIFRKSVVSVAVLTPISFAYSAAARPQQKAPAARHTSPSAAAPAQPLPGPCLHPAKAPETLRQLLDAIADHPTAGAYNTLGALFAQQGLDACALSSFEAALHLDPKNWEARYNLAIALIKRGDRKRAEQELRAAIAEKPDSASAHHALATLLEAEKKLPEATAEYQAVLSADPQISAWSDRSRAHPGCAKEIRRGYRRSERSVETFAKQRRDCIA